MSKQDWPVGTVATATVGGVERMRVVRTGEGWFICSDDTGVWQRNGVLTDVRPLVVLDLAAGWQLLSSQECAAALHKSVDGEWTHQSEFVHWLANQIEAQTKPPIPEPSEAAKS